MEDEIIRDLKEENEIYSNLFREIMDIIKYATDTASPTVCEIKHCIEKYLEEK